MVIFHSYVSLPEGKSCLNPSCKLGILWGNTPLILCISAGNQCNIEHSGKVHSLLFPWSTNPDESPKIVIRCYENGGTTGTTLNSNNPRIMILSLTIRCNKIQQEWQIATPTQQALLCSQLSPEAKVEALRPASWTKMGRN